eukprot:TRINITY_DN20228_c0_g1_i2.p1 TRINITY_DN20228_c0_g1~~TRINITY_DN20228_c0_g1_i2.p1  ORF type:complete len:682 (+),score=137.33 TRINITY_DN20228_c0_g1_i2:180-2048(+)
MSDQPSNATSPSAGAQQLDEWSRTHVRHNSEADTVDVEAGIVPLSKTESPSVDSPNSSNSASLDKDVADVRSAMHHWEGSFLHGELHDLQSENATILRIKTLAGGADVATALAATTMRQDDEGRRVLANWTQAHQIRPPVDGDADGDLNMAVALPAQPVADAPRQIPSQKDVPNITADTLSVRASMGEWERSQELRSISTSVPAAAADGEGSVGLTADNVTLRTTAAAAGDGANLLKQWSNAHAPQAPGSDAQNPFESTFSSTAPEMAAAVRRMPEDPIAVVRVGVAEGEASRSQKDVPNITADTLSVRAAMGEWERSQAPARGGVGSVSTSASAMGTDGEGSVNLSTDTVTLRTTAPTAGAGANLLKQWSEEHANKKLGNENNDVKWALSSPAISASAVSAASVATEENGSVEVETKPESQQRVMGDIVRLHPDQGSLRSASLHRILHEMRVGQNSHAVPASIDGVVVDATGRSGEQWTDSYVDAGAKQLTEWSQAHLRKNTVDLSDPSRLAALANDPSQAHFALQKWQSSKMHGALQDLRSGNAVRRSVPAAFALGSDIAAAPQEASRQPVDISADLAALHASMDQWEKQQQKEPQQRQQQQQQRQHNGGDSHFALGTKP